MKQLRILTGRHAGARIRLTRPVNSIGPGPDADLRISDWQHEPATLEFDQETDVIQILEGPDARIALEDFQPLRFGDVALAVGPLDDALWPPDLDILKRLLKPPPKARAAPPRRRTGRLVMAGGVACTMVLAVFAYVASEGMSKAKAQPPQLPLEQRVGAALNAAGVGSLTVRSAGRSVVVEGLVDGATEMLRVREALARFDGSGALVQKYASAEDVTHAIGDALSSPALHVRYAGGGVFVIEGDVANLQQLRASTGRIAADLGGLVRRIDIAAAELPPASVVHVDAMLVDSTVQYVQTRDGTKHLVLPTPDPTVH